VTLGADTILSFGSLTDDTRLEQQFVKSLTSAGLSVKLLNKE
jgi:hypothetical protein